MAAQMMDADGAPQPQPYTPKNILVTGGAGFIGSHVVMLLVKTYPQYNIVNFDKLDACSSLKNLASIENAPNYTFVKGNIMEASEVEKALSSPHLIDTVMHFAAQTHVDNSFGNSMQFTLNNVLGTHTLLEICKNRGGQIRRFIHVSTDEVYGETTDNVHESSVLEPTNPYAATKAAAEFLVKAYHRSFNFPA